MHSTAEDSISSRTIAAGDGREVAAVAAAAAAAAVATNTTTTASHSYYNLCNFCLVSKRGAQDSERSNELEQRSIFLNGRYSKTSEVGGTYLSLGIY